MGQSASVPSGAPPAPPRTIFWRPMSPYCRGLYSMLPRCGPPEACEDADTGFLVQQVGPVQYLVGSGRRNMGGSGGIWWIPAGFGFPLCMRGPDWSARGWAAQANRACPLSSRPRRCTPWRQHGRCGRWWAARLCRSRAAASSMPGLLPTSQVTYAACMDHADTFGCKAILA